MERLVVRQPTMTIDWPQYMRLWAMFSPYSLQNDNDSRWNLVNFPCVFLFVSSTSIAFTVSVCCDATSGDWFLVFSFSHYMSQILAALHCCHACNILHRDIKVSWVSTFAVNSTMPAMHFALHQRFSNHSHLKSARLGWVGLCMCLLGLGLRLPGFVLGLVGLALWLAV